MHPERTGQSGPSKMGGILLAVSLRISAGAASGPARLSSPGQQPLQPVAHPHPDGHESWLLLVMLSFLPAEHRVDADEPEDGHAVALVETRDAAAEVDHIL